MTAKPLTTESIALTEKKMDMKLEDIIKLSKNKSSKPGKQRRISNKSQKFANNFTQDEPSKMRRYMESRSSVRQGALAKRRSTFQGNQFPIAAEVARKAVNAPLRNTVSNRNRGVHDNYVMKRRNMQFKERKISYQRKLEEEENFIDVLNSSTKKETLDMETQTCETFSMDIYSAAGEERVLHM
ncbi:hypothetical protein TanjilG_20882 [Lupinus angustifolius]|uniref:Uncharacterized protein n=1 Tax=Lupinus angustifolius TaxID=3871 RepID=A0A1J7HP47_LUPAN|nr:hypothetical protein TanjilG_20882 [Lupinus angustifolius]